MRFHQALSQASKMHPAFPFLFEHLPVCPKLKIFFENMLKMLNKHQ